MEYMDQIKQHNIQTLGQSTQFSKKSIQIILSISAFSILFSCSPWLPLFSNCISTISTQLFSYTADRKYIFLFFNGILVFLIRNCGTETNREHVEQYANHQQQSVPELAENRGLAIEEEVGLQEDIEKENWILVTYGDNENEEEEDGSLVVIEEEDEEGMGLPSAEELNKKCDEFIRKMREGIKIEAQAAHQLIMV